MSKILTLCCDTAGCHEMVHSQEAIDLVDPPPRDFRIGVDHGHMQLCFARDIEADLHAAALAAGWHWDGSEWRCKACTAKAVEELEAAYAALDTEALFAETVAHSMNL